MIVPKPSESRGQTQFDWLDSRHTFSFGDYHDPDAMGFRALRVINDDRIAPGGGFPFHPHRDMEIVTWVLEGAVSHRDSMGNEGTISAGQIQHMTAGRGVRHSEFNASSSLPLHLLQIWILPEREGLPPAYRQSSLPPLLAIHGGASLLGRRLDAGQEVVHVTDRHVWIQLARGRIDVNGTVLEAGDGAAATGERRLRLHAIEDSELLIFDLE